MYEYNYYSNVDTGSYKGYWFRRSVEEIGKGSEGEVRGEDSRKPLTFTKGCRTYKPTEVIDI